MTTTIESDNYNGRGRRASCEIIDNAMYFPSREAILKEIEKSIGACTKL